MARPIIGEVTHEVEPQGSAIVPVRGSAAPRRLRRSGRAGRLRAAARIGARAFTHRSDIWLGQGESVTEALKNAKDAIRTYLKTLRQRTTSRKKSLSRVYEVEVPA